MFSKLGLEIIYYINLAFSLFNNCLAIAGLVYTIRKLIHIVKKKRYVKNMGNTFGYETSKWKYVEKQLRISLFLVLLSIEWLYITLFNIRSILHKVHENVRREMNIIVSESCVLLNGTYLSTEYDTSKSEIAYKVVGSFQQALFLYGLWIACIFLSHICKAMNKLVEGKKLVCYSFIGSFGAVIVFVISCIPVLSLLSMPITIISTQVILIAVMIKARNYLSLLYQKNMALELSYTPTSSYMRYRRWLYKQYLVIIITLAILFQIYIMRDICKVWYVIGESLVKNPCWFKYTFKINVPLLNHIELNPYYLVAKLTTEVFMLPFNIGLTTVQMYVAMCFLFGKKKPKRKSTINGGLTLSTSLLSDHAN